MFNDYGNNYLHGIAESALLMTFKVAISVNNNGTLNHIVLVS